MTTNNANTIRLHRVLRATPERVYRAFIDASAMSKWLPPNGFTGQVHHIDAKVGGNYKMSFTVLLILGFLDFAIEAAIEFERLIPKSINLEIVCLT